MHACAPDPVDLIVVGGGINGVGIARDAAGRGLSVLLVDQGDLASATSSASSKLIHGGLRYLEHYEFRLVAEALAEREVLLHAAPHIVHPRQFVMPHVPALRPAWVIRAGLFLYDTLARRQTLPRSHAVDLRKSRFAAGLKDGPRRGFVYSDCWVDDARLVVLTARGAADWGATIATRTRCTAAQRNGNLWQVTLERAGTGRVNVNARALANVTGPWAMQFLNEAVHITTPYQLRLVQGSHIVVPALYEGDHAFILQNDDRRVIFVYGYEGEFTLIGTTEVTAQGPGPCFATPGEIEYLIRAANRYFKRQISTRDVVWSYCGVRPLFDDGSANASAISRDYVLHVEGNAKEAPLISVIGGKITTHRRLAEQAVQKLAPWFAGLAPSRTESAPLPGGDLPGPLEAHVANLIGRYPRLPAALLQALALRHGTLASRVLGETQVESELGEYFGGQLYAREVDYFIEREWAVCGEDVLWRRSKAGLRVTAAQQAALAHYIAGRTESAVR